MRAITLLVCIPGLVLTSQVSAQDKRPNILVIVSDDQRFDLMGCAGHPILKTPNMDRLAKGGVRFRNMFATTPICAASRASILTGLYERTHKFTFKTVPLSAEYCAVSYPLLLRQAGYRTGLIGKFGVSVVPAKTAEMFDVLTQYRAPFLTKLPSGEVRHIDQLAADDALAFLKKQDPKQPFCLSISFNSPHAEDGKLDNLYPWPSTVNHLYVDTPIPDPPLVDQKYFKAHPEFLQKALNRVRWYWQFDTPEKYVKNVRAYYRMISGIDFEIGRILEELARLGMAENTIVIFTADNGYFLGERGFSGKWVHYEESLRVPLIVFDPRVRPEERRREIADEMALNVDLAPTILEYAGLKVPDKAQGRSLIPLIRTGRAPDWRKDFFCEHLYDHPEIPKWEGVRGGRYVYARYFDEKPAYEFLHDLATDPQELRNLAPDPAHAAILREMRARCDELRDAYGGAYSPERFPSKKAKAK